MIQALTVCLVGSCNPRLKFCRADEKCKTPCILQSVCCDGSSLLCRPGHHCIANYAAIKLYTKRPQARLHTASTFAVLFFHFWCGVLAKEGWRCLLCILGQKAFIQSGRHIDVMFADVGCRVPCLSPAKHPQVADSLQTTCMKVGGRILDW